MIDNFYTVVSHNEADGRHTFGIGLNAGHAIFGGHFPGNPVVPGVCTLIIIRQCVESIAGRALRMASMSQCKFVKAIVPADSPLQLTVELKDGLQCMASVAKDGDQLMTVKTTFAPDI